MKKILFVLLVGLMVAPLYAQDVTFSSVDNEDGTATVSMEVLTAVNPVAVGLEVDTISGVLDDVVMGTAFGGWFNIFMDIAYDEEGGDGYLYAEGSSPVCFFDKAGETTVAAANAEPNDFALCVGGLGGATETNTDPGPVQFDIVEMFIFSASEETTADLKENDLRGGVVGSTLTTNLPIVITITMAPPPDYDFGDAPDDPVTTIYPTLLVNSGARHDTNGGGPWLGDAGDAPDVDADGQPNVGATGDDTDGNNDENGITITGPVLVGLALPITFEVSNGPGDVSAWIDYNADGDWDDPCEFILDGVNYATGVYPLPGIVPFAPDSVLGDTYLRIRITTTGSLDPDGPAPDGEVEDHLICIKTLDYGDAPDPLFATAGEYPTLLANEGARHFIEATAPYFDDAGAPGTDAPDGETDGQPNATATGDDINLLGQPGYDDEDGVVLLTLETDTLVAGAITYTVANGPGDVSAWIDYNANGVFDDPGETLLSGATRANGTYAIGVTAPLGSEGTTYVRFRITSSGALDPNGLAPDGEVEDHLVVIEVGVSPECVKDTAPFYNEWRGSDNPGTPNKKWASPDCWCYQRQCRGDVNGLKAGSFWVNSADLTLFIAGYVKGDVKLDQAKICADLDHKKAGSFRVSSADLTIFVAHYVKGAVKVQPCALDWEDLDGPNKPGVGDGDEDYNFWITP